MVEEGYFGFCAASGCWNFICKDNHPQLPDLDPKGNLITRHCCSRRCAESLWFELRTERPREFEKALSLAMAMRSGS